MYILECLIINLRKLYLLKKNLKKEIFISGNFNILHPGHLRLLSFARNTGHKVVVGIFSDEVAGKLAYVKEIFRLESLKTN